jgi:hypothetical protein
MLSRLLALTVAGVAALAPAASAQDPSWTVVRPNVTWDNHWKTQPAPQPLFSVLDEPVYIEDRPELGGDRAVATRRKQRFAIGFSAVDPGIERYAGGQAWVYIGIRKRTVVDLAIRTRRNGRVTIVSSLKRQTPPITLAPENPPVGPNGFRGWLPITLPALSGAEADRISLAVRISPASPRDSLSRVYAAFAELYPDS